MRVINGDCSVSSDQKPLTELLSVVVPVFNESEVLKEFHERLMSVLGGVFMATEIVYVDDGSTDTTRRIIIQNLEDDDQVAMVALSRNFGKEIAVTAGLDHAQGDAVIIIDADLQDPPELIPRLIAEWRAGYDVVYAKRRSRPGETWLKRFTAAMFYRLMQFVGRVRIPENVGDYRLLSRRAADAVGQLREHHRFMKGLFTWIGYPQKAVLYDRDARFAGETKWNYRRLVQLAMEGVTSFTVVPLKLASYLGLVTATGAFIYGSFIIAKTVIFGIDFPGYASLMVVVLFLGGIQLTALGIIGEYLGRVFNETKRRPLYFVEAYSRRSLRSGENESAFEKATLKEVRE